MEEAGYWEWPYPKRPPDELTPLPPDSPAPEWEELTVLRDFRRRTVITTITIVGPKLRVDDYPVFFGPHGDEVRTLP